MAKASVGPSAIRARTTPAAAFIVLLGFFVVEYTRPGIYFPVLETLHINSVIPLAAFALALISPTGRSNTVILRHPITKWMLFFVALFLVQFFTSDVKLYVYQKLSAVTGYLLIYYAILRNATNVARCKAIFATLVGVHVVMLMLHPNVVLEPEKRHYIGGTFLGDGNDFAWSACIAAPMAFFLFRHSKSQLSRLASLATLLLMILAVIGTQSRGGSIALGIVAVYLVMKSKRRVAGMAWLAALLGVVLMFAPANYYQRMETVSTYHSDGSAQGRIMAWESAVRMATDHPLVGVGAGHFSVKFGTEYRPPGVGRRQMPWLNAHSIYFVALGEFGFSGVVFLLSVIVLGYLAVGRDVNGLIRRTTPAGSELRDLALAVQCSLIGFAIAGAFLSGLYYPHLFVITALCVAVSMLARESARNQSVARVAAEASSKRPPTQAPRPPAGPRPAPQTSFPPPRLR